MIVVELNGVSREFKFSAYSLMQAEKIIGESFIGNNIFENLSLEKVAALTWAALWSGNKKLTFETVADWIPFNDSEAFEGLVLSLLKAFYAYRGIDTDELEKKIVEGTQTMKSGEEKKSGKTGKRSE